MSDNLVRTYRPELLKEIEKRMKQFPNLTEKLKPHEFIYTSGVGIPKPYLYVAGDLLTPEDILNEPNAEVRTRLIQAYTQWHWLSEEERGSIMVFIRDGGGRVIETDQVGDYTDAQMLELNFPTRGQETKLKFIKLINQTIEPAAKKMTKIQRLKAGLTEHGQKIYIQGIPDLPFKRVRDAIAWTFRAEFDPETGTCFWEFPLNYALPDGRQIQVTKKISSDEMLIGHQGDVFFCRLGDYEFVKKEKKLIKSELVRVEYFPKVES